jgi:hypothetical protein
MVDPALDLLNRQQRHLCRVFGATVLRGSGLVAVRGTRRFVHHAVGHSMSKTMGELTRLLPGSRAFQCRARAK